jgi:CelD/BcsL family acetyltransferase involved in cellulose biosynthesis
MTWTFQPAQRSFAAARAEWDELNHKSSNHVLLDSDFVEPLLRHFGDPNVLLASRNDGNPGMALLQNNGKGAWQTFQPSQAPIGLIQAGQTDPTGNELLEMTRSLPGYALQLSVLQQDPDYTSFPQPKVAAEVEPLDYIQTARITLSGTFAEYWKSRGTNLRHNLARRRRRMTEQGYKLELVAIRDPHRVAEAIREYGVLESKGWKAREGTAVAEDNAQGRFYREVFERFCARGEAAIYQLRLNGRLAATDLCLNQNGMFVILKTAYDEELNEFSPAFLMREEVMKELYANQAAKQIEFYGRVMEWHTRWSNEIRTLYHLTCYRHSWVKPLGRFVKRFL